MATLIQTYVGVGGASSTTVPFTSTVTSGHLILVYGINRSNGSTPPSVTGSWSILATLFPYSGDKSPGRLFAKIADGSVNDGGVDGIVQTFTGANTFIAAEWSGLGLPPTASDIHAFIPGTAGGTTVDIQRTLTVPTGGMMLALIHARTFGGNTMSAVSPTSLLGWAGDADWPALMGYRTTTGSVTTHLRFAPDVDSGLSDLAIAFGPSAPAAAAGVFIDWDNDGFDIATKDDLTADHLVARWVISRGASAEITGGSQPGQATLTVKNTSDRFNPRNASSPLYGLLRDGPPIWIGPNSDGAATGSDPRGLFGGRIADITLLPTSGATVAPLAEIACEDALGWYQRTPARVDYGEGRAHDTFRELVLEAGGETRFDLAHEIQTMPLSHADGNLLPVLDAINSINGTRHFAKPADQYTDWYSYTTRNRQWRLNATSDASLNAGSQHVTDTSGWRLSADTVINRQRATVTPIVFTPATFTVWEAEQLPIGLTVAHPYTRIVDFDDVVRDAHLDLAYTGSTVTSVLTVFGTAAKIQLSVASGSATISNLSIEGRLVRRPNDESAETDDTTSQAPPRGIRAGSDIGNEYLGVIASAQGIADHVVWRYGNPQFRPTLTVQNWFPTQFDLDLYDVISFTSTQLGLTNRLFEIVGLTHEGNIAASAVKHHVTTYVLQECKVQSDPGWFVLNSSTLAASGTKILAY